MRDRGCVTPSGTFSKPSTRSSTSARPASAPAAIVAPALPPPTTRMRPVVERNSPTVSRTRAKGPAAATAAFQMLRASSRVAFMVSPFCPARLEQARAVITRGQSMSAKPRVFVTRKIPSFGLDQIVANTDADVWPGDLPPPYETIRQKAADCEGLVSLLTDKID